MRSEERQNNQGIAILYGGILAFIDKRLHERRI
mgnify:CR=1 FL=1